MNKEKLKYYEKLDQKNESNNTSMIPLSFEFLVKSLFERKPKFLRMFLNSQLKSSLNIDFEDENISVRISNNDLPKENKHEHYNKVDILLYAGDKTIINIEINTESFKSIFGRNFFYFLKLTVSTFKSGEESKNIKEYTVHQLNINTNKVDKKYGYKDIRPFEEESFGDLIDELGDYIIHVKNIAYYYNLYYNEHEKLNDSEMWLLIFSARSYSELYELLSNLLNEEDTEEFMEEMEKLNSEDFVLSEWERKQLDQMVIDNQINEAKEEGIEIGEESGIQKTRVETAKEMIKENMDTQLISKITHLTEEEIENLK